MSRWEFMRRLEELLMDIPPIEREEALTYYNDYISEAGKENEAYVLASLGSPEKVAAIVRDGLEGSAGVFTEKGFRESIEESENQVTHYQAPEAQENNAQGNAAQDSAARESTVAQPGKKKMSGGMLALIIVLCVLALPLIIGLFAGALRVVFAIPFGIVAVLLAIPLAAVILLAVGIILVPFGIIRLFSGPLSGLALIASGLVLAGIGILFLVLAVLIFGKLIPAIARGIGHLFRGKEMSRA